MKVRLGVRATLVLLVLVSVLPIVLLVIWTSIADQKAELKTAEAGLRVRAQQRARAQEHLFEGVVHMIKVISHSPYLRNPRSGKCSTYLRELNALFPQYAHLAFADAKGYLVCRSSTTPGPIYLGDRQYFKGAVASGWFTAGEYLVSRVSGKPSIALSMPMYRVDGRLQGVLHASLELTSFQKHLRGLAVPPGVTDLVTDAGGILLASKGEQEQPAGQAMAQTFLVEAIRSGQAAAGKAPDGSGQEWLYAVHRGEGGLVVMSIVSKDSVLHGTVKRLRNQLLVLAAITSVALFLAWQIGDRALAKPIKLITSKITALEHGAVAATLPPALSGTIVSELRHIGHGIDDITQALETRALQRDQAMAEIVEQKRSLESSERRYPGQLEASPQPMWVFDTQTLAFLGVNDAAVLHYGYSREEFMMITILEIMPAEDIPLLIETLNQQESEPANEVTLRHRRKNGEVITVEMSTSALNWDGRPARLVIAYDVSSREAARRTCQELQETHEQQITQRTRELQLANEELEAFCYSVSHDLRAPLAVVDGFCHAIIEGHSDFLPAEVNRYLERIRAATAHMNALIEDLLSFSRTARVQIEPQHVNVTELATEVVRQLCHRFPNRQVDVHVDKNLQASGDPALLIIVLTNLIGNAWKFTSKTPHAMIRVGRAPSVDESEVVFHVSDNGSGFDMAFVDKLFKAFQRLHSASEFEGTGIGLAIVNRIIHRHGGRVWAQSEPGQGAIFFFSLPVAEQAGTDIANVGTRMHRCSGFMVEPAKSCVS